MADYQKMYSTLFNAITDAIHVLQQAQQTTEEMYITVEEPNLNALDKPAADSNIDSNN